MNSTRIVTAALIALTFAQGHSTASQSSRGSVSGVVVSAAGENPVERAVVTLDGVSVATREDGKFAFLQVEPGEHRLTASAPGYAPAEYGQPYPPRPNPVPTPVLVGPGERVSSIVLRLIPGGVIAGVVTDQEGNPVREVQVEALQYTYQGGLRTLVPATASFKTNDLGQFRVYWLGPGGYVLRLTPATTGLATDVTPSYFPGVTNSRGASLISVAPGQVVSVSMKLPIARLARLEGAVINGLSGEPASAQIILVPQIPEAAARLYRASANGSGLFVVQGVPSGSYYVYATVGGSPNGRLVARVPVEVGDRDIDNLVVVAKPLGLKGTVAIEGWPEGVDPSRIQTRMSVELRLDPLVPAMDNQFDVVAPRLQAIVTDGAFSFPSVMPADYQASMRIAIAGFPNAYLKSVRFLDSDVIDEGLHLENRLDPFLDVAVGVDGASIAGVVVDGQQVPLKRATVTLLPDNRKQMARYHYAQTDEMGHFEINGIAPGDYRALAWEDIESGAWLNPDAISEDERFGAPIRFFAGGRAEGIAVRALPYRPR
ncbi:MAG TPA: carboxypeptidase-like regulatory domain-containing protein [Terriglobia bacterium]|nr:carboxypeptidase-like regulatory domain-containing protein [Terriglobia bacterium]